MIRILGSAVDLSVSYEDYIHYIACKDILARYNARSPFFNVFLFPIAPILVELRPTKNFRQNMLNRGSSIIDNSNHFVFCRC